MKISNFWCIFVTCLLFLMLVPVLLPGQQNIGLSNWLTGAISAWEKNTGIAMMPEVRSTVHSGFLEYQELLRGSVTFRDSSDSEKLDFINTIVAHYLYDVRDAKIRSQTGNADADRGGRQVLALGPTGPRVFLLSAQVSRTATDIAKLYVEDIKRFSIARFIDGIKSQFERRGGYLEVSSSPKGAEIDIDDEHKGFTIRIFFVSVGAHPVAVVSRDFNLECRDKVNIEDRKTAYFRCPM